MSDPYLLAATLLANRQMLTSPDKKPLLAQLDQQSVMLGSSTDQKLGANETIVPSKEVTTPEFSKQRVKSKSHSLRTKTSKVLALTTGTDKQLIPHIPSELKQKSVLLPISGTQLYFQRLAALKTGKIYTRVLEDQFSSSNLKTTRKPTYQEWKKLLAVEARAIALGQGANHLSILVGDSLSLCFPVERLSGNRFWLNQGISGDTSGGILRRLSAFAQTRPDVIYLMAGINDLRKGAKDKTILDNYRQILRYLRRNHPQSFVIVQSILPTRFNPGFNDRIRKLNEQLLSMAHQEGANYLNLQVVFTDDQGNLRRDLTTDGLHLSQRGYELWHSGLKQAENWIALNNQ
ncbi:lipolytic protein G-D-S-L family [Crinalium epipsammum PCC 9333]|uniref:Lipolytic protein G-D-S-L family n=1 Tax=Crinalium epipsammum PCC 9333 TaxID=1173022 RepID=K9VZM3_9CYAN|nr:GDSL-type esterase/lipase family protein [Crinalium epipsammum]AFZ12957.1 lipolytic protein G-D-S-L family [Crinalium epipsammum PCC 9333]